MSTKETKLKHPKEVNESFTSSISYTLKSSQTLYTISLLLMVVFIGVVRSVKPGAVSSLQIVAMTVTLPLSLFIFCKATKRFITYLKEKNGDISKEI